MYIYVYICIYICIYMYIPHSSLPTAVSEKDTSHNIHAFQVREKSYLSNVIIGSEGR